MSPDLCPFGCALNAIKGPMFAATVQYSTLEYQTQSEGYVNGTARKDMITNVLERLKEGHVSIVQTL